MCTAFLSGDGKTKVNMFFRANDHIQLTKLKIKVYGILLLQTVFALLCVVIWTVLIMLNFMLS